MPVHHMHATFTDARRGHQIPQNWNYGLLGASVWMLKVEPRSSGRMDCVLHGWALSPPSDIRVFNVWNLHVMKDRK